MMNVLCDVNGRGDEEYVEFSKQFLLIWNETSPYFTSVKSRILNLTVRQRQQLMTSCVGQKL